MANEIRKAEWVEMWTTQMVKVYDIKSVYGRTCEWENETLR